MTNSFKDSDSFRINIVSERDVKVSYFASPITGARSVRIEHPASGAVCKASESDSLEQNREQALKSLYKHPLFKRWLDNKMAEIRVGETLVHRPDRELNTRREIYMVRDEESGNWKEVDKDYFSITE